MFCNFLKNLFVKKKVCHPSDCKCPVCIMSQVIGKYIEENRDNFEKTMKEAEKINFQNIYDLKDKNKGVSVNIKLPEYPTENK